MAGSKNDAVRLNVSVGSCHRRDQKFLNEPLAGRWGPGWGHEEGRPNPSILIIWSLQDFLCDPLLSSTWMIPTMAHRLMLKWGLQNVGWQEI